MIKIFVISIILSVYSFSSCSYTFYISSSDKIFKELELDCLDGEYVVGQTFTIKNLGNEYFCSYKKNNEFSCYYEVIQND